MKVTIHNLKPPITVRIYESLCLIVNINKFEKKMEQRLKQKRKTINYFYCYLVPSLTFVYVYDSKNSFCTTTMSKSNKIDPGDINIFSHFNMR